MKEKKQEIQTIPGYRVNEYLLVLCPHRELWDKILKVKEEFANTYQVPNALWTKPHVSLARFSQYEMLEERIRTRLKIIAMAYHPIKIELKDFGSYPSHTIFINMISKEPVKKLIREIRVAQRLMKLNEDNKPHFFDEPSISIARKLLPWQYEKSWLEYSNRHFTGRFIAQSMLLLKRKKGEKAYQVAERFEFMNLPVETKQGDLFG